MQIVRTYSSLTEAQLAKLQLESEGIEADILDEATASLAPHLTFATGIRLAVADEDFERARDLLGLPPAMPSAKPKGGIPWWFFAIVGVAIFTILFQASRFGRSSDSTSGGKSKDSAVHTLDRNGDGKADERTETDPLSRATTVWRDDNFDGKWDGKSIFKGGVLTAQEIDLDFDGTFDSETEYRSGLPVSTTARHGGKGPVVTLTSYRHGRVTSVLTDQDADGKFDLRTEYDAFGVETKREELK